MNRVIRVADLVGKDVSGMRAIVTQPEHYYQYPSGVPIVTLKTAERVYQPIGGRDPKKHPWLRITFSGHPSGCDFSGMAEESHPDWSIRIVEESR